MDPHSDDESDRVDVHDGEAPDEPDQGMWVTGGDADDGLQVGSGGREDVETPGRIKLPASCDAGTRV